MKQIFAIFVLILSNVISVKGQCDMLINYSVEKIPSTSYGTLRMILPDGKSTIVLDDTVKQMQKEYHLEQLGEYRLTVIFSNAISGRDSLERTFTLTGEECKVETTVHFWREQKDLSNWKSKDSINSGRFTIIKYSNPSPLVKIKYLRSSTGENNEFPGPQFIVKNESRDTLYGEWLPGYFWGTFSRWVDGEYVGNHVGQICTTWTDEPPLYPDSVKLAWVASFGARIPPGKYRFNLYYSTENKIKGSTTKLFESDTFRWWSSVQNWHLLTCEFETKPKESIKPSSKL
ncbi:MAG: hypothetical protein K6F43_07505 [Prevotella sp.]|nr:hypothetical protein [Prevotella sp.]